MTNFFVTSQSKYLKCFGFLILMLLLSLQANAQTTVTGTVSDANGPIPGANVNLKGTKTGVSTSFDGNYSISVPSNGVLVFSFLGLKNKEVTVNGQTRINVTMEEDSNNLKEVVVIGYGAQRKEAVTGSVASITGSVLREVPSANVTQALQGRVAGVQMSQTSSKPGATMQIRIRGTRSLTAGNDPLVVVDGIQGNMDLLNQVPPSEIETVVHFQPTGRSVG